MTGVEASKLWLENGSETVFLVRVRFLAGTGAGVFGVAANGGSFKFTLKSAAVGWPSDAAATTGD